MAETWIKSEQDAESLSLPKYKHYYNYRKNKRGGGVSIYVHNSLKHSYIEELCENDNHFLWIHLERFSVDIGAVYKPERTNDTEFMESYSQQLLNHKRSVVFGDYNYDLLKPNQVTNKYKKMLQENAYVILNKIHPLYSTRETNKTKTILDHASTYLKNNKFHLSIINSALSDHKHIYLELHKYKPEKKKIISYEAIDYTKLYSSMKHFFLDFTESELKYEELESGLIEAVKQSKIKKRKIQNPPISDWINKDIIDAIENRNQLWSAHLKNSPNKDKDEELVRAIKEVRKKIQETKSQYYYNLFKNCTKKPQKMWKLINSLCTHKLNTQNVPSKIETLSGTYTKLNDICNCLNSFFSNIGFILANEIPQTYHDSNAGRGLIENTNCAVLTDFEPATTSEVIKIIDNLNANTSTGIDGISCKVLKCVKILIAPKLTHAINICLQLGYFPDSLKIAKVSPILKSGKATDPGNYRPISVLPIVSKVFEKIIYNRLDIYLKSINFLYDKQYGFRSKSNTLSACIDLITNLKNNMHWPQHLNR